MSETYLAGKLSFKTREPGPPRPHDRGRDQIARPSAEIGETSRAAQIRYSWRAYGLTQIIRRYALRTRLGTAAAALMTDARADLHRLGRGKAPPTRTVRNHR
jgi:hypothetical protein